MKIPERSKVKLLASRLVDPHTVIYTVQTDAPPLIDGHVLIEMHDVGTIVSSYQGADVYGVEFNNAYGSVLMDIHCDDFEVTHRYTNVDTQELSFADTEQIRLQEVRRMIRVNPSIYRRQD